MKQNPIILSLSLLLLLPACQQAPKNQALYDKALENGKAADEGVSILIPNSLKILSL